MLCTYDTETLQQGGIEIEGGLREQERGMDDRRCQPVPDADPNNKNNNIKTHYPAAGSAPACTQTQTYLTKDPRASVSNTPLNQSCFHSE